MLSGASRCCHLVGCCLSCFFALVTHNSDEQQPSAAGLKHRSVAAVLKGTGET